MQHLLTDKTHHTLVIMLNRPDALNALNQGMIEELAAVVEDFKADPDMRGAVIIGAGDKAFAAGADITEFAQLEAGKAEAFSRKGQAVFEAIEQCPKPIIAAVNGYALGGGCELAMACHLRVATERAQFGQPEVKLGVIAGYGGTQRLVRLVGRARATELLITGKTISAEEAYRIGLVNHLTTKGALADKCKEILNESYQQSPLAIQLTLEAIAAGASGAEIGYQTEAANFAKALTSADGQEGTAAFLEKRRPQFTGT